MPNYKIMGELSGDLDAYNHGSFAEKAFHYTNGDDYYDRAIAGETASLEDLPLKTLFLVLIGKFRKAISALAKRQNGSEREMSYKNT